MKTIFLSPPLKKSIIKDFFFLFITQAIWIQYQSSMGSFKSAFTFQTICHLWCIDSLIYSFVPPGNCQMIEYGVNTILFPTKKSGFQDATSREIEWSFDSPTIIILPLAWILESLGIKWAMRKFTCSTNL